MKIAEDTRETVCQSRSSKGKCDTNHCGNQVHLIMNTFFILWLLKQIIILPSWQPLKVPFILLVCQ